MGDEPTRRAIDRALRRCRYRFETYEARRWPLGKKPGVPVK
jgi:hypothetical protein